MPRRLFLLTLAGSAAVAAVAGAESDRQPRADAPRAAVPPAFWRPVADGFLRGQLSLGRTELFRIDLSRYATAVVVPGKEAPRTAAEMRAARGALLAVNGGFFDENGKPLGLRIEDGQTRIKLRPRVDWGVVLLRAGSAAIVHSRDYVEEPNVMGAIQVGPRLLVDGRPTRLKPQSARRTVVGVDRSGRWLTVGTSRDRVLAEDLAAALAGLDVHAAMMLDGGPSAQLSAKIGTTAVEIPGGYSVPDGLLILPARP